MRALVTTCRDPFRPANHRTVDIVRRGHSLRNLAPRTRHPVICQVNGKWISRKAWARRVRDGDSVVFLTLPHGGGQGGSNPLRVLLMIVVASMTSGLGGALLGVDGAAAVGSWGVGIANAIVSLVGQVNFPRIMRCHQ